MENEVSENSADHPNHDEAATAAIVVTHNRIEDLRRVATGAHALTFDHEGVPTEHLLQLAGL